MEDLLSCTVCCEPYHEKHRQPVLLPRCGHSFCRPCIGFLVKKGSIMCPSCRMDQRVEGAESLPTEFSLLAISLAQQVTKQETCQDHGVKLSFWCKTCNVPACGECLFEDHPMTSHAVIKSTAYVNELKESVTDITNKFMKALDGREKGFFQKIFSSTKVINDALRTITVLRKDMEEARDLMKGVKLVEGIGPSKALSESAKFLGLKWNLQDVNLNLHHQVVPKSEPPKETLDESTLEPEPEELKVEDEKSEKETSEPVSNGIEETETSACEKEKEDDEKEKDSEEEEEETLTEEELRKRRKIQRLKERLAAATAAAEQAKQESKDKNIIKKEKGEINKEKKTDDVKKTEEEKATNDDKGKTLTSRDIYNTATKNLKPWQRRSKPWEPTPREPSITPEKEITPKTNGKIEEKESEAKKEDNSEEKKTNDINETEKNIEGGDDATKEADKNSNKESNDPASTPVKENAAANSTESNSVTKVEPDSTEGKTPTVKRQRGRLARNALKRAQTMDLSKKLENSETETNKDEESNDIKGLDLEKTKSKSSEKRQAMTKEAETQTCSEVDDTVESKTNEKEAKEGEPTTKSEEAMFEMEPEEKERIATELLQVPSLTVCIEGIGGLLARVTWESVGLHIYSHQFQELPYDIIIKSNVLHALIPTKDPMVFLDIATDDQHLGRVYISLWGHLRRANNLLLLCLGDRGRSLRLSRFFNVLNIDGPGERLLGGDYEYNDGHGGESLIDDLEKRKKY